MLDQTEPQTENLRAIPLHQKKSKYDIVHKGMILYLDFKATGYGYHAFYYREIPLEGPMAFFMGGMDGEKVHKPTVAEVGVSLRWWDKILGTTLDQKLKKAIDRMKKDIEHSLSRMDEAEKLKQELL